MLTYGRVLTPGDMATTDTQNTENTIEHSVNRFMHPIIYHLGTIGPS